MPSRLSPTNAPPALWITVLALLSAIAPLATDMYLPAFPELTADLGTTASSVQLSLTTFLVGLGLGQLVIGPLSDRWGRRGLLIGGTLLCLAAGIACAVAPTIAVFVAARFAQGFGGAAGIVLSRAVIVDRTSGDRTARLFSLTMAIGGVAPVVSPLLGSTLLGLGGWRAVFLVLAALAALMAIGVLTAVPETLPAARRVSGGLASTGRDIRSALHRRSYLGYILTFALSFATMFAYISGSPFVLQNVLGLSTTRYATAFGANALGLVLTSLISSRLTSRVNPRRQLSTAVAFLMTITVVLLCDVLLGMPRWPTLILLFATVSTLGFILGTATALASAEVRDIAGTGSALLGTLQFGLGAVVSPLVGSSATTMATVMLCCAVLATLALHALTRPRSGEDTDPAEDRTPAGRRPRSLPGTAPTTPSRLPPWSSR